MRNTNVNGLLIGLDATTILDPNYPPTQSINPYKALDMPRVIECASNELYQYDTAIDNRNSKKASTTRQNKYHQTKPTIG